MSLPIVECIYIPSDESEAVTYLASLLEQHPGIADRLERTLDATCSARTVLKALVEDGTFESISEDYASCLEEEGRRHEAEEQERAGADVRQRA